MPSGRYGAMLVAPSLLYVLYLLADPAPDAAGLDLALGHIAYLVPAIALIQRGRAHRGGRVWTLSLAAGICLFVVGADLYSVQFTTDGAWTGVLGAIAYLSVYPLLLVSVLTAARAHLHRSGLIVAIDGLTGALAAAATAGAVLSPVVEELLAGSTTSAVAVFFPAGDVLLVAAALGAVGLIGFRDGRRFALWAAGMVVFVLADIVYVNQLVDGVYRPGTWLDGIWAVGCSLMAVAASWRRPPRVDRVPGAGSLSVAAASAVTGIAVLVLAPASGRAVVPASLAVCTLACCGFRFLLAFLQLRELADVRELSLTDELTGVANRRSLYDQLDQALTERPDAVGSAAPLRGPALVLADLDHFKEVNDTYGHATGDQFLRAVVDRFAAALEATGVRHLISRLGGDEFAVLLHPTCTTEAALTCAEALSESLREVVVVDGVRLHARASIGVALAPEHATTRSDLLFAADAAMYAAKTSGDPVTMFSDTIAGNRRQRLTVAENLYHALERDELVVEYQPIVAIGVAGDLDVVGVESLVRWNHPTRGRVPPDEFLPSAERHRLTAAIARRVLDVTLRDLQRWRALGRPLRASVNVSASDLRDDRLVSAVSEALQHHGANPDDLTIEVTETAMMRDPEMARSVMTALSELGVRLSVDDYGTGYSSLEYLLRLPIDEIKLDRAFSHDLTRPREAAIARSTIDLTHALGLHMVAEGVENEGTLAILRDLGCDLVQGWHLGRPMPASSLEEHLGLPPMPPGTRLTLHPTPGDVGHQRSRLALSPGPLAGSPALPG